MFSIPTTDRGRFSGHLLLSVDKMCISFFSLRKFSQKMMTCTILSQNGESHEPIFLMIYPFNFNAHNEPGSIFQPSSFFLSVDKMCFSFFSSGEFSEKLLTCPILSQNSEGRDPFFGVIYPFHFNTHNGPGSIFQPLPSIRG